LLRLPCLIVVGCSSQHRGLGTFYKHSIFEPGKPQCANALRLFQWRPRLWQGSPPETPARLTDQYETDRPPKSAPNPLQKMDVPDWLFSRDPAREGDGIHDPWFHGTNQNHVPQSVQPARLLHGHIPTFATASRNHEAVTRTNPRPTRHP
jgi:hypothetical protein